MNTSKILCRTTLSGIALIPVLSFAAVTTTDYQASHNIALSAGETNAKLINKDNTKTPVVRIIRKNDADQSIIKYDSFNVGSNGLIFNNRKISASTIINEVHSTSATTINGNISVRGKTADIIIVNPNGIIHNSGSHYNINNLTLISGSLNPGENYQNMNRNIFNYSGDGILINNSRIDRLGKLNLFGENIHINDSIIAIDRLSINVGKPAMKTEETSIFSVNQGSKIKANTITMNLRNSEFHNNGIFLGDLTGDFINGRIANYRFMAGDTATIRQWGKTDLLGTDMIRYKNTPDFRQDAFQTMKWGFGSRLPKNIRFKSYQ